MVGRGVEGGRGGSGIAGHKSMEPSLQREEG